MEVAQYCIIRNLSSRIFDFTYSVKGKDKGKCAWHYVLLDWDKKDEFLEKSKTGSLDVAEYGKILASGWGDDIPEGVRDKANNFDFNFSKHFFLLRFKTDKYAQTYYVLSDAGKEFEMKAASSVEDIRRCGRILYSSFDEEPAEALLYILTAKYFGLNSEINWNIDSPFDKILNGDLLDVQEYLKSGRDINCTDSRGWTLLHHFAKRGNICVISNLKGIGADIQVRDKICGRKPVHIAARESQNSAIQFFLKNGAIVDEADENNWTLLHYAAWKGNVKTVRLLIEHFAEINAKALTFSKKPIHIAAEYGNTDVIEVLLENGASIEDGDDSDRTPLYYAALLGHLETAKFLIDKGADIYKNTKINTRPVHAAASGKNTKKVLELFLALGVNVNEPDGDGNTPLHRAATKGNLELVQFLINKNANLNIVNKDAQSPLDLSKEYADVYLFLLDRMSTMFQNEEKFSDALNLYREIIKIQTEKLGPTHPETLKTRNQEAKVLYKQGQYDAAATNFQDVLGIREICLGDKHIDTLETKHGLGLVLNAQIKYDKAIEIFKEVLEKRQASLGLYHHDTLNVARDLALVHFRKGELDEALKIFEDVFEKRKAHFGEDHQDTLQVRQDMAVVLVNKGDYKTALQIFQYVLQKSKETLGDNHPDTLLTKDHISIISQKFGTELKESSGCLIQ